MNIKFLLDKIDYAENEHSNQKLFKEKCRVYSFINRTQYLKLKEYGHLYEKMDGLFVDGIFMVKCINLFTHLKIRRHSFDYTSLAKELFEYLNTNTSQTIYFIGATQEEIEKTIKIFTTQYPNMNIIGYRNGYFDKEALENQLKLIIEEKPDFLVVSMGFPLQDEFIVKLKEMKFSGIAFTSGAFIRQSSRGLQYYPNWINKYNLRWLYRLFNEKGMSKRTLRNNFKFVMRFIKDVRETTK